MYRSYERKSLERFAARHGFVITEGSGCVWVHDRNQPHEYGCRFWEQSGKYEFYFHPDNFLKEERNFSGLYQRIRGQRFVRSDSGFVRICTWSVESKADWNGGKAEYYELFGPFVGLDVSRPEDVEYFRQFFQGEMPEGIFRDWLVDNHYLSR